MYAYHINAYWTGYFTSLYLEIVAVVVLRFFSCIEIDDLKEKLKMATLVSSSNSSGKKSKSKRRVSCSSQAQKL
ncbi:hypothetical protein P3L10_005075 [Capsicum annuum]